MIICSVSICSEFVSTWSCPLIYGAAVIAVFGVAVVVAFDVRRVRTFLISALCVHSGRPVGRDVD